MIVTYGKRNNKRAHNGRPYQEEGQHSDDVPRRRLTTPQSLGSIRGVFLESFRSSRVKIRRLGGVEDSVRETTELDPAALANKVLYLQVKGDLGLRAPPGNSRSSSGTRVVGMHVISAGMHSITVGSRGPFLNGFDVVEPAGDELTASRLVNAPNWARILVVVKTWPAAHLRGTL